MKSIQRVDQSVIVRKLEEKENKLKTIEEYIDVQRNKYDNCYDANMVKPRHEKQVLWHQKVIRLLEHTKAELSVFITRLEHSKSKIFDILKGVDASKRQHEISRCKKESRKKTKHRRNTSDVKNSHGFIHRIAKPSVANTVFHPHAIKKAKHALTRDELKPVQELKKVLRPVMDQKYIEIIRERGGFDIHEYDLICDIMQGKLCASEKKNKKELKNTLFNPAITPDPAVTPEAESDLDVQIQRDSVMDVSVEITVDIKNSEQYESDPEDVYMSDACRLGPVMNSDGELESI
jgi:hypothetical protein